MYCGSMEIRQGLDLYFFPSACPRSLGTLTSQQWKAECTSQSICNKIPPSTHATARVFAAITKYVPMKVGRVTAKNIFLNRSDMQGCRYVCKCLPLREETDPTITRFRERDIYGPPGSLLTLNHDRLLEMPASRGGVLAAICIFTPLTLAVVLMRIWAVHLRKRRFKIHDYLIFIAEVSISYAPRVTVLTPSDRSPPLLSIAWKLLAGAPSQATRLMLVLTPSHRLGEGRHG